MGKASIDRSVAGLEPRERWYGQYVNGIELDVLTKGCRRSWKNTCCPASLALEELRKDGLAHLPERTHRQEFSQCMSMQCD